MRSGVETETLCKEERGRVLYTTKERGIEKDREGRRKGGRMRGERKEGKSFPEYHKICKGE